MVSFLVDAFYMRLVLASVLLYDGGSISDLSSIATLVSPLLDKYFHHSFRQSWHT